jgi:BirA family biotin operon repressor/biotin-[acetyl-CoA-carboxylase] ligase
VSRLDPRLPPDLARAAELARARGGRLGAPLAIALETESTNDDAKRAGRDPATPHGAVWVADAQTRGRGRQGRAWLSPRGENLLFSVLLRVTCPPGRVPPIALAAGLAVRDAVATAVGDDAAVKVKWPNDVLVRGKKIAGVLVESSLSGARVEHVVVGIGVNVHTRAFPEEIASLATSVALEAAPGAPPTDRAEILADVLAGLDHDVEHVAHKGLGMIHARLARSDALAGRAVTHEGARGIARGIDPDGRLVIERDDGAIVRVVSGEVLAAERA